MADDVWFCPSCRRMNDDGLDACPDCGHHREAAAQRSSVRLAPCSSARPDERAPRRTDLCAVLALVFALLSLALLPVMFGPAAVVCGVISLVRLNNDKVRLTGKGLAVLGLIVGILTTGVVAYNLSTALDKFKEAADELDQTVDRLGSVSVSTTPRELHSDLEIGEPKGAVSEYGSRYLTGVVVNRGEKEYQFVMIEFPLLDQSGNLVGKAQDAISGLRPGDRWRYRVAIWDDNAVTVGEPKITAY